MTESEKHFYEVKVSKNNGLGGTKGRIYTLESTNNPNFEEIKVQTPAEFKGPSKNGESLYWTPEDLFVSALAVCLQATFVTIAENSKLAYNGFSVTAKGTLDKDENGQSWFSEIVEDVIVCVPDEKHIRKAERVVHLAENNCLIANSMKSKITLNVQVKVAPEVYVECQ